MMNEGINENCNNKSLTPSRWSTLAGNSNFFVIGDKLKSVLQRRRQMVMICQLWRTSDAARQRCACAKEPFFWTGGLVTAQVGDARS
jgi:hypothetical protein